MERGELWWASLPVPRGSEPGYRRPVVVVQANSFNQSGIRTVITAAVTSNIRLGRAPGNVPLPRRDSGLTKDSVINVSQLYTIDKTYLTDRIGRLSFNRIKAMDEGLRLVLDLDGDDRHT